MNNGMSAIGTKRTFGETAVMSALGGKADMAPTAVAQPSPAALGWWDELRRSLY
jgi:hypothetical protein